MKASSTISIQNFTYVALMTAILCILGPIAIPIPFSPVPISLATFGLYLIAYIMPWKKAVLSCILYLIIGLAGMPVLSGFSGGFGKVFGPTGGYILAYIPLVLIVNIFIHRFQSRTSHIFGFILSTIVLYGVGSLWLVYTANITLKTALFIGTLPYVPGDVIKIFLALYVGPRIRTQLNKIHSHT